MPAESGPYTVESLGAKLGSEFEVMRQLGEGSTASVFLAREAALQRLVAIKVLRAELDEDDMARKRFAREGRSAARISHPNVITVYRVGEFDDGAPYLVTEYVQGRTLDSVLKAKGPLAPLGFWRKTNSL